MASEYGPIRAYARMQMRRWAKADWSAGKIRARLQERYGAAYRWQTLLADYREFKGMYAYEDPIRRLSGVRSIPRTLMTEIELRQRRKYRLIGEATYYDKETGREFKKHVSMYTEDRMSKEGWTSQFDDMKRIYRYQEGWGLLGIDWRVVQHNRGWDY